MIFLFAKPGSIASASGKVNAQATIPPPNEKVAAIVMAKQMRNFIHNERRETAEIDQALVHKIDQPARRSNDDIGSAPKRISLFLIT